MFGCSGTFGQEGVVFGPTVGSLRDQCVQKCLQDAPSSATSVYGECTTACR